MKILFYNDAPDFGGHEVMSVEAVKYLLTKKNIDLIYMFYERNERLHQRLTLIQGDNEHIELLPTKYKTRPAQGILTIVSPLKVFHLMQQMKLINPDVVVIIQGSIEVSSLGLVSSSRGGFKTISYIPNAYKLSFVGLRFGALRDIFNNLLFKIPCGYITVSRSMKDIMVRRGVKKEIIVVNNGIDVERCTDKGNRLLRHEIGLGEQDYVVAIIGRIYFKSKGHDLFINAMASYIDKLQGIKLLVVGDGQDREHLRHMVISKGLDSYVRFIPWSNDLSNIYAMIDMVIMPSRNEGLPLVLLEAMCHGLPIIASNLGGIAEILSSDWLFNNNDSSSIIQTLLRVKKADNTELIKMNKDKVLEKYNQKEFGKNFESAIYEL